MLIPYTMYVSSLWKTLHSEHTAGLIVQFHMEKSNYEIGHFQYVRQYSTWLWGFRVKIVDFLSFI